MLKLVGGGCVINGATQYNLLTKRNNKNIEFCQCIFLANFLQILGGLKHALCWDIEKFKIAYRYVSVLNILNKTRTKGFKPWPGRKVGPIRS